jgi:ribonuclease VapC
MVCLHVTAVIAGAATCFMSAASYFEAGIVLTARFGDSGGHHLRLYLNEAGVEIVSVDREQADLAIGAWARYGKGRHSAALNYGDCFAHALASSRGAALLFVGDDFTETDVVAA